MQMITKHNEWFKVNTRSTQKVLLSALCMLLEKSYLFNGDEKLVDDASLKEVLELVVKIIDEASGELKIILSVVCFLMSFSLQQTHTFVLCSLTTLEHQKGGFASVHNHGEEISSSQSHDGI
jgi:hypothetical protein